LIRVILGKSGTWAEFLGRAQGLRLGCSERPVKLLGSHLKHG